MINKDLYEGCKSETRKHKQYVGHFISILTTELSIRGIAHDDSKLESPEVEIFAEYTPKLKGSTYGSEEYKTFLKEMKPALDHHYSNNKHHPEYFENGIRDMDLIDLLEMLCDWKAATLRHDDGDIVKSLEINKSRFNISDDLCQILLNTIKYFK